MFLGVSQRFRKCAEWYQKIYGFGPLLGLFFNLCINACFPDKRRVHCAPHADAKNIVGVCVLVIYQLCGKLKSSLAVKVVTPPQAESSITRGGHGLSFGRQTLSQSSHLGCLQPTPLHCSSIVTLTQLVGGLTCPR